MPKFSEKVRYMITGAVIAVASFTFGHVTNDINAQSRSTNFETLEVDTLSVSDSISLLNNDGIPVVVILSKGDEGLIGVLDKDQETMIMIGISDGNGIISILKDKDLPSQSAASMGVLSGEGFLRLSDKYGDTRNITP